MVQVQTTFLKCTSAIATAAAIIIMGTIDRLDPAEVIYTPPPKSSQEVVETLSAELLEPSNKITWDLLDLVQSIPAFNKERIFDELMTQPDAIGRTSYRFKRHGLKGEICGYKEEFRLSEIDNANAGNSLSVTRQYGLKQDARKGKTTFLPFQPGGVLNLAKQNLTSEAQSKANMKHLHRSAVGLLDTPEGLSRGLRLDNLAENTDGVADLDAFESPEHEESEDTPLNDFPLRLVAQSENESAADDLKEIDDIMPFDYTAMKSRMENEVEVKRDWAHVVDLNHKIENFEEVVPNMAREWPFELDTFQKEAVYHLEQGDSVFVAAHTSAGKTVVAEYAIAMAARNMTKTIYTSPIKALSNQKFRDFKETFKDMDIGLITGDVQINPDANCLIMTTEILRSMLYRGADLIRDVEFVIFDEVHYVNDIDRGVVWEEVIIMLPDHVKYILLSATVPNTFEFANWVGRTKQKDIYVISTPKRPVPLEIFVWAKNDLYKAINANGVFSELEFKKHKEVLVGDGKAVAPSTTMGSGSRKGPGGTARGGNRGGGALNRGRGNLQPRGAFARDGPSKQTWVNLVQYLSQRKLLPAVVFVFSKKRCEDYVDTLSGVNFCNAKERSEIHMFIDRAVARLKKEDRELPQILKIRDLLSRGIAVHHGGLLPIVKECIEILFSKSLVKVLFATETFAMGLNLPTRTVVFCELRKHDGRGFRNLLPGEFTQMAGRAGRRGLDSTGTVIIMSYKQPLSPTDFKEVTMGAPNKLLSQFRLTYNMILNLLRIEALRVEEMIKHSFSENSSQTLLPEHKIQVDTLYEELSVFKVNDTKDLSKYEEAYNILSRYQDAYIKLVSEVQKLSTARNRLLNVGKLIVFRDNDGVTRFGFLFRPDFVNKKIVFLTFNHGPKYESASAQYNIPYVPDRSFLKATMESITYNGDLRMTSVSYEQIQFVSRYRLKASLKLVIQNDKEAIKETEEAIKSVIRFQYKLNEVLYDQEMHLSLHELIAEKNAILEQLEQTDIYARADFKVIYAQLQKRDDIKKDIDKLKRLISDENLELLPDYEQRLAVLKQLNFIDENQNVALKGRVACEINSGWELVLTELILDNFLGDFEPEEIVALLSCFVYEGRLKEEEPVPMTPRLEQGRSRILSISEKMLKIFTEHLVMLTSEEEEFLERNRFALVNVVYEWARGLSFREIMQISVELEGTIVRVITRLDEICRQVKDAALIVGDSLLHSKMSEAQERIKRDIVFCASLYL